MNVDKNSKRIVPAFDPMKFKLHPEAPALMGGINLGDPTSPALLFRERFGERWLKPQRARRDDVFVLYDKEDKCCFSMALLRKTLSGPTHEFAFYNEMTREEFDACWNLTPNELGANAVYFDRDPSYKYDYLQLNEILKQYNIGVF